MEREEKMEDDTVVYVQCPHCGKGWYGKFLEYSDHWTDEGAHILDAFYIQGFNPTNITEPIYCLNCHKWYTPLGKEIILKPKGQ